MLTDSGCVAETSRSGFALKVALKYFHAVRHSGVLRLGYATAAVRRRIATVLKASRSSFAMCVMLEKFSTSLGLHGLRLC